MHHSVYLEVVKESGELLSGRDTHRINAGAETPHPIVQQFVGAFKDREPETTGTYIEGYDSFLIVWCHHDVVFSAGGKPSRSLSQRSLWAVRTDPLPWV